MEGAVCGIVAGRKQWGEGGGGLVPLELFARGQGRHNISEFFKEETMNQDLILNSLHSGCLFTKLKPTVLRAFLLFACWYCL